MWTSGHNGDIKRAAHGYEPTREAAMDAFAPEMQTGHAKEWLTQMSFDIRLLPYERACTNA
jgi:hypothetical protein